MHGRQMARPQLLGRLEGFPKILPQPSKLLRCDDEWEIAILPRMNGPATIRSPRV